MTSTTPHAALAPSVLEKHDVTFAKPGAVGLGGATEVSPGQFQVTDPQATNAPRRFYRVRSPQQALNQLALA